MYSGQAHRTRELSDSFLREDENRLERVGVERVNVLLVSRDELNELRSGAVADAQPNELRRMAVKQAALLKV